MNKKEMTEDRINEVQKRPTEFIQSSDYRENKLKNEENLKDLWYQKIQLLESQKEKINIMGLKDYLKNNGLKFLYSQD